MTTSLQKKDHPIPKNTRDYRIFGEILGTTGGGNFRLDPQIASIDTILASWRQGDCVLGSQWFAHRIAKWSVVAEARDALAQTDADLVETEVPGFIVVTQTCDIVRSCAERPFIELCPLVEVDNHRLEEIKRCRRPAYAFVPLLSERRFVADLDRVMTVEKPFVATWC